MIAQDSPFRRLPPGINRRQAVFLDGIRHAAEIVDVAYSRLVAELTEAARLNYETRELPARGFAPLFLDAWAIVDAVDRVRGLLLNMPGAKQVTPPDGEAGFMVATASVRDLRNVADHLPTRVDYVIANEGTALGKLSWVTQIGDTAFLSCSIVPGTVSSGRTGIVNPLGQAFEPPTDLVILQAGEHQASLSAVVSATRRAISLAEQSLAQSIAALARNDERAGADIMVTLRIDVRSDGLGTAGAA